VGDDDHGHTNCPGLSGIHESLGRGLGCGHGHAQALKSELEAQ
jgi:hypothetical protein